MSKTGVANELGLAIAPDSFLIFGWTFPADLDTSANTP